MKKIIMSMCIVVLCCCFFFVSEVDAAGSVWDYSDPTLDDFYEIFSNVNVSSSQSVSIADTISINFLNYEVNYSGLKKGFAGIFPGGRTGTFFVRNMVFNDVSPGDTLKFSLYLVVFDTNINLHDCDVTYIYLWDNSETVIYSSAGVKKATVTYSYDTMELIVDDVSRNMNIIRFDFVVPNDQASCVLKLGIANIRPHGTTSNIAFNSWAIGMITPYVTTGLTDEEKSILQQIMIGVDNANLKLDQMQTEQSSYYESVLKPNPDNQDAAESMSGALESGKEIVDEYSSLNASLEKPMVDDLLPDYDRVVDGYVDTSIFDVFSSLYESGYIMFILLITCFFGVMSYALFGKKA